MASWSLGVGFAFFCLFVVPPVFADSFQLQIGKWFAQGRTPEIERALTQKLGEDPSQTELWLELADLRKSQCDYPGAAAAYGHFLSHKDDWRVRADLALTEELMGRFTEARAALTELDQAHPGDPEVLWGLARSCYYQWKWKDIRTQATAHQALLQARQYLQKLVSLKPHFALAVWRLAEVSEALGDNDGALKDYQEVVKQDASYKWAHRHIAKILAQEQKYSQALEKYEQAIAIEPDDVSLRLQQKRLALLAPKEQEKRQKDRLDQWESWVPPEETTVAPSGVTIRVGIATGLKRLLFRGESDLQVTTPASTPVTVLKAKEDYQLLSIPGNQAHHRPETWVLEDMEGNTLTAFSERIWIAPQEAKPIALHAVPYNTGYFFAKEEDRAYRGILEIAPHPGAGFTVVNRVSLEDYLAGVLPAEIFASWPMETLKAQAIVARTYVLSKTGRHNDEGFDVCDSVHCQVYLGLGVEKAKTNEAIRQTAGIVLKHGGEVMPVAFSDDCGGHTQDYEEAWGYKNAVVGVADYDPKYNQDMEFPLSPLRLERWVKEDRPAWCRDWGSRGDSNYRWVWVMPAKELEKKVAALGRLKRLVVTHRSSAGWADRLLVVGENGEKEYHSDSIRGFLGGIRSNLIWIEPQFNLKGWPEEFIIYGGGWGHGVGMCQVGARGLAVAGKTCEEIVMHYFPKATITKLDNK